MQAPEDSVAEYDDDARMSDDQKPKIEFPEGAEPADVDGVDENDDGAEKKKRRKRRKPDEITRKFICDQCVLVAFLRFLMFHSCDLPYGALGALQQHIKKKHPGVDLPTRFNVHVEYQRAQKRVEMSSPAPVTVAARDWNVKMGRIITRAATNANQFISDVVNDKTVLPIPSPALAVALCSRVRMLCRESHYAVLGRCVSPSLCLSAFDLVCF